MSADFDFIELVGLEKELGEVPEKTIPNIRKSVEVSARLGKDTWSALAAGAHKRRNRKVGSKAKGRGLHAYHRSIDYDLVLGVDGTIGAEIGPNLGRPQGSFGFVEGGAGIRSAPRDHDRMTERIVEEDFLKGLSKAVEDSF
ncbi:hypothetical protein D9V32_05525 [Mycetocola tolaasinivorans]|uniref:HK97 gp10 family phage protein n=1 Tax=Mycetocola tolaasinivorans TaxID=76635 RepID=A0A3L7A918_9MICO|nr:hypothetical protein [Mycetocola tolaasinivorans]RLP76330.1 hypothetical protein D9V32_05525 [Mycetocola tolaasinivorans]